MKHTALVGVGILSLIAAAFLVYSWANPHQQSYRVNVGQQVTVDEPDLCQKVTNSGSYDLFVPTNTSAEWAAFRSNLPTGVSLSACQSNPSSLSLSHNSRSKSFTVSWTGGSGNGGANGCKLQYFQSGSTWTDITSATNLNCDANLGATAYNLNADGWKSSWGGTSVRVVRKSDSTALGTFGTTLSCGSASCGEYQTSTTDEDCDGYWDNAVSSSGCPDNGYLGCYERRQYSGSACSSNPSVWYWCIPNYDYPRSCTSCYGSSYCVDTYVAESNCQHNHYC